MKFSHEVSSPVLAARVRWAVLGVGGLLCLAWTYWQFVAAPMLASHLESLSRLESLNALMETQQRTRQSCDAIRAEAKRLDALDTAVRGRIPGQPDESDFLKWISRHAEEYHLTINDFRPVSRTIQKPFEVQTVRIASSGSYAGICRLLDGLRSFPRLCRVASWEIAPSGPDKLVYSLTFQVQLYSTPDDLSESPPTKGS